MIHYISIDYVIKLHDQLVDEYGGRKGILNIGLLISALEMPKSTFNGRDLHRTVYDKAAAYLFHLIKNHPFVDGNKRTAAMVSIVFLSVNKSTFSFYNNEYENLILQVAKSEVSKKEIQQFFRRAHRTACVERQ